MDLKRVTGLIKALSAAGASLGSLGTSRPQQRDRSRDRPTGLALRNPNDPVQAERIEAARFKRAERAVKAQRNYNRCIAGGI